MCPGYDFETTKAFVKKIKAAITQLKWLNGRDISDIDNFEIAEPDFELTENSR